MPTIEQRVAAALRNRRGALCRLLFAVALLAPLTLHIAGGLGPVRAATLTPEPPEVWGLLFWADACDECQEVLDTAIARLQGQYRGQLRIQLVSVESAGNHAIWQGLLDEYAVPAAQRRLPTLLVGTDLLCGASEIRMRLPGLVKEHLAAGGVDLPRRLLPTLAPALTPRPRSTSMPAPGYSDQDCDTCQENRIDRLTRTPARPSPMPTPMAIEATSNLKGVGLLRVVGSGLVDGTNPLVFATMVSLLAFWPLWRRPAQSRMSVRGRVMSRDPGLLLVGAVFLGGILLIYLGASLGYLHVLPHLPTLGVVGAWIYGLAAIACVVLAAIGLEGGRTRAARRKSARERNPRTKKRRRTEQPARKHGPPPEVGLYALAALPFSAVVSLAELARTGQIYLPTASYMQAMPAWRHHVNLALTLYSLAFVLPPTAILLLTHVAQRSERVARWKKRHATDLELALAGLFLLLAGWLGVALWHTTPFQALLAGL